MISGARSLYAIFPWGRLQPADIVVILGFVKKQGKPNAKTSKDLGNMAKWRYEKTNICQRIN
jgi:hypothetical protein